MEEHKGWMLDVFTERSNVTTIMQYMYLCFCCFFLFLISYSGNFYEKTLCELVEKKIFAEKIFVDCLLMPPKDATPQISCE